jgi:hypothetical protein
MDLSFLIPSKIRRRVLEFFVENPELQMGVRELARELQAAPQPVYRELLNLENWGFLFSSRRGNQRAFRLNKKFPFYPPIADLFRRMKEENNREFKVAKVLDWEKLSEEYKKIPVPESLIPGLKAQRTKPRAWAEEKLLKKKGML